ncbi:hypothetical protein [Zymomonas mobilis]|uniref:hypothetical protein n=1 Tax=Zymomonas mobilis TaxID=542 RepID=UPI00031BD70A|nr:hypothetical protein [Zymomonas mobilis]MDX5947849.1 hypothetical protein [Zymomonas mobilis subsp. pomaceae]
MKRSPPLAQKTCVTRAGYDLLIRYSDPEPASTALPLFHGAFYQYQKVAWHIDTPSAYEGLQTVVLSLPVS